MKPLMVGICTMCKEKGTDLTTHHVHEAPKKDGRTQTIMICQKCHANHNLYTMALRDNNIVTDRRELEQ